MVYSPPVALGKRVCVWWAGWGGDSGEGSDDISTSSCSWEACVRVVGGGGEVTGSGRVAMVFPPPVAFGGAAAPE